MRNAGFALILFAAVQASRSAPQPAQIPAAGTRNAIVGRVTAPDGSPVSGAVVTLLERTVRRGEPAIRFVNVQLQIVTDADGRYAIERARLGEFFVIAIPHNPARGPDGRPNRMGYARTFFPSAKSVDEASAVMINMREAQTADIRLLPAPLAVLRGIALTSSGGPATGTLHIAHGDHLFGIDSAGAQLRTDGTFVLGGVPPGTYFLQFREGAWPPPRGEMAVVSGAKVVVEGRDVDGIRVAPIRAVHVTGKLVVDPAVRAQLSAGMTVVATPVDYDGNPGPRPPGRINGDLTFAFDTWPGLTRLGVLPEDAGWQITRITWRGADVTREIDLAEGTTVSDVEIALARVR